MEKRIMKNIGLYIHIPFCESKCPYCDFYSVKYSEKLVDDYINRLEKEIYLWSKKINVCLDTIYFGGGTPGLIGTKRIIELLKNIKSCFKLTKKAEITLEINPSDYGLLDFEYILKEGINRISVGAQSAKDNELMLLGRRHRHNDTIYTVKKAIKSGFENISLDLMLAIQNQDIKSLEYSINQFLTLGVKHISCYLLKIEENTPYFKNKSKLLLPKEEEEAELYMHTCRLLEKLGFIHYEISNFCKKGFESKHNLKYWNCEEYLGIGPSAHSFLDGKRFYYSRSIKEFIENPVLRQDGFGGSEEEFIMLKLRLSKGLLNEEYLQKFGVSIPDKYFQKAEKYVKGNLVICDSFGIRLTDLGFLVSNRIILDIIR